MSEFPRNNSPEYEYSDAVELLEKCIKDDYAIQMAQNYSVEHRIKIGDIGRAIKVVLQNSGVQTTTDDGEVYHSLDFDYYNPSGVGIGFGAYANDLSILVEHDEALYFVNIPDSDTQEIQFVRYFGEAFQNNVPESSVLRDPSSRLELFNCLSVAAKMVLEGHTIDHSEAYSHNGGDPFGDFIINLDGLDNLGDPYASLSVLDQFLDLNVSDVTNERIAEAARAIGEIIQEDIIEVNQRGVSYPGSITFKLEPNEGLLRINIGTMEMDIPLDYDKDSGWHDVDNPTNFKTDFIVAVAVFLENFQE